MFHPKIPRLSWRKIARGVACVLALLVVLYGGGANVLLSSGAIAHLVSKHPERLRLQLKSAHTFWPGRVHVEGFELRGRSAEIEWALHIDAADADLSLFSLLRHRFHVSKVVATGVTFRTRFRLDPAAVNPDRVARMPSIDGFDAVPLLGVPPEPSGVDAEKPSPWIIDLQGVEADAVREVWIDAFRVAGTLGAKGGFTLGDKHLAVAPATAEIESVALTTGDDAIAKRVTGRVDAQIDTVDLDVVKGAAVLRSLTMHSGLHGEIGGIRFIRHFLRDDSIALEGGAGIFRSEANVVRGLVKMGTDSHIELAPATVTIDEHQLEGRVRIDLTTGDADAAHATAWSAVSIGLADVAFTEPHAKHVAATCTAFAARAHAQPMDLADPASVTRDLAYSWETARVDALDLHAIDEAIPKDVPFHIERGAATFETHGHGSLLGASAEVAIESALTMKIWGARVASGTRGTVSMKASFVAQTLDLAGTDLTLSDPARAEWWSKVKLGAATVHFDPPSIRLAVSTTARDARPFLSFYEAMQGASPVARTALDLVPAPLIEAMTANMHGSVRLAASKGAVDLEDLEVQGASSRLRGALKKRGDRMDGGLLVEAGPTALGISFTAGKTGLVVIGAPKWFAENVAPRGEREGALLAR